MGRIRGCASYMENTGNAENRGLTELVQAGGRAGLREPFRTNSQDKVDTAHQHHCRLRPPLEPFRSRHVPVAMIQTAGSRSRAAAKEATPHPGNWGKDKEHECRKSSHFCHHASHVPKGQDYTLRLALLAGVVLIGST